MPVPADAPALLRGPVPRVAVATLLIAAVLGVVQGAVWAWVAPQPPYLVYADGTFAGLPTVSSQLLHRDSDLHLDGSGRRHRAGRRGVADPPGAGHGDAALG